MQAKDMPNVAVAKFPQLEDKITEAIWMSSHQAAIASQDGFLYSVEMRAESQWRLTKFQSKPTRWLVDALVPEAPVDAIFGLAAIYLSDQLEKVLSVDESGVVKLWDVQSR